MPRLPPELRYSGVHISAELLDYANAPTLDEIVEILKRLSAYDCMGMIGRLSASLYVTPMSTAQAYQLRLVDWLAGFDPDLHRRLRSAVMNGAVAVFEQQLVHLARLVVLHASERPPDDFAGNLQRDFLSCLFGVPDLLEEPDVDLGDTAARLSWALRHAGVSHVEDRLTLWSTYYEVFLEIWPHLANDGAPDADAAFTRYTGLSIEAFMTCGFAFSAAFGATNEGIGARASVDPQDYFSSTKLDASEVGAFLSVCSSNLGELRREVMAEDARWGPTVFGALTFERTPLLKDDMGRCYVVNLGSLERRVTHGILHLLAEGSMDEGLDREHFTAPFGAAFQEWSERSVRRTLDQQDPRPQLIADEEYGDKRHRRRTSDLVLRYPRQIVLAEVVAGPLQARTVTRGDLDAFEQDVAKLVEKKAKQLTRRAADIVSGDTRPIGLDAKGVVSIWPVIVSATAFPHRPEILTAVRKRVRSAGLLTDRLFRPICLVSAEELAAAEGALEEGASLQQLLAEWKHHRATGDHAFKNFLIDREVERRRRPAKHHRGMFAKATNAMTVRALGSEHADELPPPT